MSELICIDMKTLGIGPFDAGLTCMEFEATDERVVRIFMSHPDTITVRDLMDQHLDSMAMQHLLRPDQQGAEHVHMLGPCQASATRVGDKLLLRIQPTLTPQTAVELTLDQARSLADQLKMLVDVPG